MRERADVPVELMDDFPAARVNRTARAFVHTGVDYADPIIVQTRAKVNRKRPISLYSYIWPHN